MTKEAVQMGGAEATLTIEKIGSALLFRARRIETALAAAVH